MKQLQHWRAKLREKAEEWPAFLRNPATYILALTVALLWRVIGLGKLVYGDIPDFDVHRSHVNFLYAWGPQQLGTNVRQGFNTVRDELFLLIAHNTWLFYFLKYVLPLLLIPLCYYWIFKRLGIRTVFVQIVASLAPLFTPIVFGDFLTGQTFWIYLTVPWVFYFAIHIFCLKRFTLANYFLLAIFLFLSLGALPPIIVPLLVTLVVFVGTTFFLSASLHEPKVIGQYVLAGTVVGVTFFLLSAPYLLVASSGQAAYTPASLLGDYYHNYASTDLLNTLRLAGNNGNGQTTLAYNMPSLFNIFGYLIVALVVAGSMLIGLKKRAKPYKLALASLLVAFMFIVGFMYIMTIDPLVGTKVFQSQWIVSTIRNPSKLYVIVLPIFSLLLAFSLENFMSFYKVPWKKFAVGAAAVLMIGLYGWPALRGDLGLLYHRADKVANYKPDPTDQEIARKVPSNQRSLLIPANHRDELNYQNINPGFNILELEGGQPDTTKFVRQINQSFNNQDQYFFNYLAASGVQNVFAKKDKKAYEASLFDLFSATLSPAQTQRFLNNGLHAQSGGKSYWQFANRAANPLVFSPQHLVNVQGSNDLVTKAPFLGHNTAVTSGTPASDKAVFATQYQAHDQLRDGQQIVSGKAQLHDPRLLLVDLYARGQGSSRVVVFDVLNPLTNHVQRSFQQPVAADASVITLGNERYTFSNTKQRVTIRADEYNMVSAKLQPVDIHAADPSFEGKAPPINDVTPKQKGKPYLYDFPTNDASQGKKSLLLGTKNHTGFVEKDLPVTDASQDYLLTFDYKNVRGSAPSFTVLQGDEPLLFSGGRLDATKTWQTHHAYFRIHKPKDHSDRVHIFFYTGTSSGAVSENLFDNLRVSTIEKEQSSKLTLPSYSSDYDLMNFRYTAPNANAYQNLLSDSSFESPDLWGGAHDATAGADGTPLIKAAQSSDAEDGKTSLKLESKNHTAYVAKTVGQYNANTVYKLSFYYKPVKGRKPAFAIWQDGSSIAQPSGELKGAAGTWHYYETYFVPDKDTTNLTLYLYSPSIGDHTINLFDNVSLEPASLVSTYLEKTSDVRAQPASVVESYKRLSPTALSVRARAGTGMVVFNESFQKGWKAYVVPANFTFNSLSDKLMLARPGQEIKDHAMVNGFANGWWVDSSKFKLDGTKDYQILLLYTPQKSMFRGLIVSGLSMVGLAGYFVYRKRGNTTRVWRAHE